MKKRREKMQKKKKLSFKKFILFFLFQIVFLLITTPFWIFKGPFKNVKDTMVESIMATRHKYLATIFLSQSEVDSIISKSISNAKTDSQDTTQIKVSDNGDVNISRFDIHTARFDGYILEINNPKSVKVGMTQKLGKVGQTTSEIAEENNAVAAINGGAFRDSSNDGKIYEGTGAFPGGIVLSDGKLLFSDAKDDELVDVTGFTKDGILVVGKYTYNQLKKMDVTEALSFGGVNSTLIVNGKPQIQDDGGQGLNPRTAIGQKENGTVIMLVIDGRGLVKNGATLREIQDIMLKMGAWNAANLDGGSSTTMYYNGSVINNPSNWDGERTVATAFYVEK
ncbi:MAG: phosphodiester glycosidase family protein [Bacillota bacterium]|nr:phosphodiester glycosidase family protein [Bacillota bacterium]